MWGRIQAQVNIISRANYVSLVDASQTRVYLLTKEPVCLISIYFLSTLHRFTLMPHLKWKHFGLLRKCFSYKVADLYRNIKDWLKLSMHIAAFWLAEEGCESVSSALSHTLKIKTTAELILWNPFSCCWRTYLVTHNIWMEEESAWKKCTWMVEVHCANDELRSCCGSHMGEIAVMALQSGCKFHYVTESRRPGGWVSQRSSMKPVWGRLTAF